jgi:hypothetical protein
METTDFEDILHEAASEVTALDPDNLDAGEFRALRRSAKRRLEIAWEFHYWPVLTRTEQRFFQPDYNAGTAYAAGNIAYYPPTQKYYQALQAVTGTAPADALGNVQSTYWAEAETSYSADTFSLTGTYVQTNRVQYGDQIYQLFVAGPVTGALPTDATQWALLTPFDKYVPYEQTGRTALGLVTAAWSANPKTTTRGNELNWTLSENGVQILTPINFAWLEYRIRCPKLAGDIYDATASYALGAPIYFSSAATPGNFYTAVTNNLPSFSPDTSPGTWGIVQLPRIFHKYLVHGVAADWLRGPGGGSADDVAEQMALAEGALEDQKSLLVGQQSQRVKTVVRTR